MRLPALGEVVVFLLGLALLAWLVMLVVAPGCVDPALLPYPAEVAP